MGKLSGKSGRIKIGTTTAITGAVCTNKVTKISFIAAHTYLVGQFILVKGVVGMTDLNNGGKGRLITAVSNSSGGTPDYSVSVALDTTQTWTSGGTVQRIIPISEFTIDGSSVVGSGIDSESGDWKDKVAAGEKDWKGTYSGFDYDGAGMAPLDEEYAVELDIDADNYYTGNAIFNSWKTGVKIAGGAITTMDGGFEGDGELTKVNA